MSITRLQLYIQPQYTPHKSPGMVIIGVYKFQTGKRLMLGAYYIPFVAARGCKPLRSVQPFVVPSQNSWPLTYLLSPLDPYN